MTSFDFTYWMRFCCFWKFFSLAMMADKQMFKALEMVESVDSEEEEETKGRGTTRSWLKKRDKLGYFTNNIRESQLEGTQWLEEMMRMDSHRNFIEISNVFAPAITPQEITGGNKVISAAERLTITLRFFSYWRNVSVIEFSIPCFWSSNILYHKRSLQSYCEKFYQD